MARVLVVDDEKGIRLTLCEFLRQDGHQAEPAADAQQAFQALESGNFDVVVSDIILPRVSGVQLLQQIRKANAHVQIIMITGEPTADTAAEALRAGAFDYLPKPISKAAIQKVVNAAAKVKAIDDERRRLEQENIKYQTHLEKLVEERTDALRRSRDALEKAQTRNLAIIRSTPHGLCILRRDWTIEFASHAMSKILCPDAKVTQEILGLPFEALFFSKEEFAEYATTVEAVDFNKGLHYIRDIRLKRLDGRPFWCELSIVPHDPASTEAGYVTTLTDITERKTAQQRSLAFAALGEKLNVAITPRDAADVIAEISDNLFGWDAFWLDLLLPGQSRITSILSIDTIDGKKINCPDALPHETMEHRIQRIIPNGARLLLRSGNKADSDGLLEYGDSQRRSASLMFVPLAGVSGTFGILSIQSYQENAYAEEDLKVFQALADHCSGALERIQAAEARRQSEEKLRDILASLEDVIWSTTPDGSRYIFLSPAAETIYGRPVELFHDNVNLRFECIHPADRERAKKESELLGERDFIESEFRIIRPDGEVRWLHERSRAIRDAYGNPLRIDGIASDITHRKRAEEAIRENEEKFRAVFERAAIGTARSDLKGFILETNPAFQELLGYTAEELQGKSVGVFTHPEDWQHEMDMILRAIESGEKVIRLEKRYIRKDGETVWVNLTTSFVPDSEGRAQYCITMAEDVTARKKAEEQLRFDALHDALTHLPNRALFLDRLNHIISRARRDNNCQFAVLFLDLDDFKKINDSLGHHLGDQLLLELSHRIQDCLRPGDTVARLGGDEFAILLDSVPDERAVNSITRRLLEAISGSFQLSGHETYVSASVGVALGRTEAHSASEFLRDADTAMYRAKRLGKNRFAIFDTSMHEAAVHRLTLEGELRRALRQNEFALFYQPIVDTTNGSLFGFEALLRWRHPERGLLAPGLFINLAEETGLIVPIGQWALEAACRQTKEWQVSYSRDLRVHVNLSVRQFSETELDRTVARILHSTQLDPELLQLEITESVLLEYGPGTLALLDRLKALGVKLCIDDFGTGYSSLSYMSRLPINVLKLDRSFVIHMQETREDMEIVRAVRALAKTFSMEVVAEGVETREQLDLLRSMEYNYAQGYLFSAPVDPETATQMIVENKTWA